MRATTKMPDNPKKDLTKGQWMIGLGFWVVVGGLITTCSSHSTTGQFDEPSAVVNCDYVVKQAAVDKSSFDTDWAWTTTKDEGGKTVTIKRNFSAKNAMGGNLSGNYECVVSATDASVQSLVTTDAFGIHKIM